MLQSPEARPAPSGEAKRPLPPALRDIAAAPPPLLTLPNCITFARLCAVPVAIYLVLDRAALAAFALFCAAGASDGLDGWFARRRGATPLGAVLDPLADKCLMAAMFVTLAATGRLPLWLTMLVVFRDVMIVGGVLVLRLVHHAVPLRPLWISKVNTALQIGLIAGVLGLDAFGIAWPLARTAAIWLVAASTAGSFAAYVRQTVRPT